MKEKLGSKKEGGRAVRLSNETPSNYRYERATIYGTN